jgi:hypothetical protein
MTTKRMSTRRRQSRSTVFAAEPGPFLAAWQRVSDPDGSGPTELLHLSRGLPGNARYTLCPAAASGVLLVGEVPIDVGEDAAAAARARLEKMLSTVGGGDLDELDLDELVAGEVDESVESALVAAGLEWSRRDGSWVVPAGAGRRQELRLSPVRTGVRVAATLAEWEAPEETGENGAAPGEALALFLLRAHGDLRFVRCVLEGERAAVVSLAGRDHLELDLPHSVNAVSAASHLLARELEALLYAEVSREYWKHWNESLE